MGVKDREESMSVREREREREGGGVREERECDGSERVTKKVSRCSGVAIHTK